jgi:prepilin-type N-terminal cleavage/methylation domain-containing protein
VRAGWAQGRRKPRDGASGIVEDGFTLVEVLIALAILSIAIFVVVGGMNVLVLSSRLNRSQGAVGSVVRRAAEAVRGANFVPCNGSFGASSYSLGMPPSASQLPENASAGSAVNAANAPRVQLPFIVKITNFAGDSTLWSPATGVHCSSDPNATQVVQIEDDSVNGGISQTAYVVKSPSS